MQQSAFNEVDVLKEGASQSGAANTLREAKDIAALKELLRVAWAGLAAPPLQARDRSQAISGMQRLSVELRRYLDAKKKERLLAKIDTSSAGKCSFSDVDPCVVMIKSNGPELARARPSGSARLLNVRW